MIADKMPFKNVVMATPREGPEEREDAAHEDVGQVSKDLSSSHDMIKFGKVHFGYHLVFYNQDTI